MNISFAFKNFEASEHLKKYARRRMWRFPHRTGKTCILYRTTLCSLIFAVSPPRPYEAPMINFSDIFAAGAPYAFFLSWLALPVPAASSAS